MRKSNSEILNKVKNVVNEKKKQILLIIIYQTIKQTKQVSF